MRTQLHHLVADGRRAAPRRAGAHLQGRDAHLRASCGARSPRSAPGCAGSACERGDRVGDLPRQADRDRRRRSSAPRPPAACSCRSTRCCGRGRSRYILADCDVRVLVTSRRAARAAARRARASASRVEHVVLVGDGRRADADGRYGVRLGRADGRRRRIAGRRRRRSTSTWPRSSTPRAAPASRRASCSRTATCIVGAESVSQLPRQHRRRRHPGRAAAELRRRVQPAHHGVQRRRPRRAAQLPAARATSSGSAREHRVTGLTCVPPLWIQLAEQDWPAEATASTALLRQHRRADAEGDARRSCARIFPQAQPYLMYGLTEAFRSTYLDPAEVDRRPDSIGKAIPNAEILVVRAGRHAVRPGRGGRARAPRRAGRARLLERPGAHRRAVPAGARAATPGSRIAGARGLVRRHRGRATRRASSTSSAATTR